MEDVIFHLDEKLYPFKYDRSRLQLGSLVHVKFDYQGQPTDFTSNALETSIIYAVTWITPSEWHVYLQNKFRIIPYQLTAIYSAVGGYADKTLVDKALEETQKDFRLEHLYKTKEYEKSRLSVIVTVAERLDLVTRFQEEGVAKSLFAQHESLYIYLLLTCFDRLGQTPDWYEFGRWLTANNKYVEREEIIKRINDKNQSPEKNTYNTYEEYNKILYEEYNKIYGTISAFRRFLREILPSPMRQELFDSIEYSSIPNPPKYGNLINLDNKKKEEYLIRLRNKYTHEAKFIPGVGKNWSERTPLQNSWKHHEQWIEGKKWFSVNVKNWPDVIEKAVRIGLVEYLRNIIAPKK